MSLADAVLSALRGFATEVATWTNQGSLVSIAGHIAQIENAVATDLHAGETAAKAVLADLYSAFHGNNPVEPVAAPAPAAPEAPPATGGLVTSAPVTIPSSTPETVVTAPAAADPTPAPLEAPATASSAPSSEASTSATTTTDIPAV